MTREEAIEKLKKFDFVGSNEDIEFLTALEMAIKALEQEPCEDAISRQAVINKIFNASDNNCDVVLSSELMDRIKALPPVTPQTKWTPVSEGLPESFRFVDCTCHSLIDDRKDWVVETVYIPQPSNSPYSDWGNIPMLNHKECEVIAWVYREIPEPYKGE